MSSSTCTQEATQDALLDGRVLLLQPKNGYRAAIDPVLLAAAVPARKGQNAVELGLGGGAAALCLLARMPELTAVYGLELDEGQVELAHRNAALNGREAQMKILVGDAAKPPKTLERNFFDLALMNPPYLEAVRHTPPPGRAKARAHAEAAPAQFGLWIAAAGKLLKPGGVLTLIHRADRLDEILTGLKPAFASIAILPVWPKRGEAAKRVIVQAVKGGRGACRLLPGLVLHEGTRYTEEALAVLRAAAPLNLTPKP